MDNNKISLYLTSNSDEDLNKLEKLGYTICPCCKFDGVKWVHYLNDSGSVADFHGVGNGCECECKGRDSKMCIKCSIDSCIECNHEVHIFRDVESIDKYIKSNQN